MNGSKYSKRPRLDDEAPPSIGQRKTKTKRDGLESRASPEGVRGEIPKMKGKSTLFSRVSFLKLTPLGAHVMATSRLTARQYQTFFILLRDASYGGKCFTHPDIIAKEIGMDSSDVRKALKVLEQHQLVFRKILPNKGHCYILNPTYVSVGSDEEEAASQAAWNIERIKRIREAEQEQAT